MSRLPFTIATPIGDKFDTALERAAFLASTVLLWAGGAAVGYLLTIWLCS